MDLENSLITTWKDTQVLGMCFLGPTTSGPPGLGGLAGGWGHSQLPTPGPHCPISTFGKGPSPSYLPCAHHLEAPAQGRSSPSFPGHHLQPLGRWDVLSTHTSTAPTPPTVPAALPGRGPHHRGLPGAEGARLLRHPEGESQSRAVPAGVRRDGGSRRPWDPSRTAHRSSPCVRPQVSPSMTAEELTNQVLEMRNVAASLDIWLTFEALENGELGEHGGMAQGDAPGTARLLRGRCGVRGVAFWWWQGGQELALGRGHNSEGVPVSPERPLHPKEKVLEQALQWCKLPEPSTAYLLVRKVPIGEGSCLFTGKASTKGLSPSGCPQRGDSSA